jgi:hypothetical protein
MNTHTVAEGRPPARRGPQAAKTRPGRHGSVTIGLVVVLVLALAGCAGMRRQDEVQDLELTLMRYARLMRWGGFNEAAALHRSPPDARLLVERLPAADWRVSGFEFGVAQPAEPTRPGVPTDYLVPVIIDYYSDGNNVVRRIEVLLRWWREPVSGQWFVQDAFPLPAES